MSKPERLLIVLALAAVALLTLHAISDFDTGYHVQNGAFILDHGFVPTHDIFSYTMPGGAWVNHYWLSDVMFALVNRLAGTWGLIASVSLIAALTYAFILATTFLNSRNKILATVLLVPYSILTYELWVVRPQTMTYLMTAIVIFILEKWRRQKRHRILLALPILFFLWGNMHAGVLMGIGIIGLYFLCVIFGDETRRTKIQLAFVTALSICATFLNPNGYHVATYDLIIHDTVAKLNVQEWFSLLDYLGTWQAKLFLAFIVLVLCFCLYALTRSWNDGVRQWTIKNLRDVDWPALGLLVTAFALPLLSIRHVGFFPILTFPIFIASLEKIFPRLSDKQISFVAFLFLGTLISAGIVRATQTPAINAMILPTGATQFIKDNNLQGPMFDDASFGGYLIWHLWPQQRVFIDGRDDVFAGKTVDDYLTIMRTSTGWESLVNQTYNINYFILWYRPPLDGIVANLTARLEYQLGFKLVYWDDVAIILARDNAQNKTIVNNFAYTYINPFVPAANIPSKYRAAAAQEWLRAVNASPSSKILQSYLRP